jgi:hypothetical protein
MDAPNHERKEMPAMSSLESQLRAFEARPATTTAEEREKRRHGLELGWHLNRLQGGFPTAFSHRMGDLYASGRITLKEYQLFIGGLAKEGLLPVHELAHEHGR